MKRLLHKLIHLIIMPCDKATLIIEKQLHGKLTKKEEIQLKAHLHLCKVCSDYDKKARAIHLWLEKLTTELSMKPILKGEELEHFKKQLKEQIHTHS